MEIIDKIVTHTRIMIDTAPIIYLIEEHDTYGIIVNEIFKFIRLNLDSQSFSSVITFTEVITQPLKKSRNDIVEKYRQFLLQSANFIIYPIDIIVAEKAAIIRAKYGIRTPDALQVAVGIENGATLFITNDKQLKKISEIEMLVLEEFL